MSLRMCLLVGSVLGFALQAFTAQLPEYEKLKAEAEKFYSDHSYALSHQVYETANSIELSPSESRWVQFRLADTQWRSAAATQNPDTTHLDQARQGLEFLVRDVNHVEDHDELWAEVQESLADYFWIRRNNNSWGEAWPHYQLALDWWAGAREIETARSRYLQMVWRMAKPPQAQPYYTYGYWGNYVSLEILENTLRIAQTDDDRARAHYLMALTLRNQGDMEQRSRVPEEFEAALKLGRKTDWYDDALYHYAEWLVSNGKSVMTKDGEWQTEPDYPRGLELFRRLVQEFSKGETRYWEQAQQQIKNITEAQVNVGVQNIFLPDSEIQYSLNWRNVKQIELTLCPVDLNRAVRLTAGEDWLHSIDLSGLERLKSWTRETKDVGDYKPGSEMVRLEEKLKPGAYVLEAKAGGKSSRDLLLVSDATLVLKSSGKQALLYFCNALGGQPLGGAKMKLWQRWHDGKQYQSRELEKTADKDGIAVFDLIDRRNNSVELFASAVLNDRQAFSPGQSYGYGSATDAWKIYAFTDRPAYRPKETVQWKFLVRRYNGSVYSTLSGETIEFQITDPQGAKVKEGKAVLNAFGSAWGSLELTETMPLGEYHATFFDEGKKIQIGSATLFRLEEYKLPEFKVSVQTPEADGKKKSFLLGEKVEANIQADYYFGGPVANANVEILVYQNPFFHYWHPPRDFPWYYEDMDGGGSRGGRWYGGQGQIVKRETLKTDATGKASVVFDTPRGSGQDLEYRIEARVTDSSRREILGNGSVRVSAHRYYVHAEPGHNLYRPQDKVAVNFKALDANEQPVQASGKVTVSRDYWYEIWLDSDGKEVKGEELKRFRESQAIFPPPPQPNRAGWKLKFRGYEHDDILTRSLKTDTNGAADLTFTPEREGYYRVSWESSDESAAKAPTKPITSSTTVWVATTASSELGYRHGGLEIIADKDSFRVGEKAPVMLVTPSNDRYVLFTVEGEDLYNYQLVHVEGTVKLIELDIEEKHVPNIFIGAALVTDRQIFADLKQIVVPPAKNFLNVEVKSDRAQYQPREEGVFTITTHDNKGKPVSAEVALGLVDESVFYIQQDYAGDPRQFFFGTKRQQFVQTQTTMNQKAYARLVAGENEQLIDEREIRRRKTSRDREDAQNKDEGSIQLADAERAYPHSAVNGLQFGVAGGAALASAKAANENRPRRAGMEMDSLKEEKSRLSAAEPAGQDSAVEVRTDFRSTILWEPGLVTDKDGKATVKIKYPDSLTSWKATVRVVSQANQFGIAENTTRTKKPLIVRLQGPRFFVAGDIVTLSAIVNNNTEIPMEVKVSLGAKGLAGGDLEGILSPENSGAWSPVRIQVPANSEARADWTARVKGIGTVKLDVAARAEKYSDAMERTYLAYEHGIERFIAKSGKARENEIILNLELPKERKAGSTSLVMQVTPSLAVTMLDALPYLIDYPYGCTEQTMSRFLPAAVTAKTLKELGLQPEDTMGRVFGGIEPASAAATHPKGKKDLKSLDDIMAASLERLIDFQHSDGGWGWWKQGESDPWMTAYVVWGFSLARDAGLKSPAASRNALERGVNFLEKTLVEQEENPDMQAWMLHALAVSKALNGKAPPSKFETKAFENLWSNRDKLNAYTRALLALAAHGLGKADEARTLVQNLENGVKRDERPDTSILVHPAPGKSQPEETITGTAHWGEDGIYWRWSEGGVEATAFALKALLTIDPQNKLIEPVTNWLIKNRRGAQWNNTRDTAIVILVMNDYLRVSGELKGDVEYDVVVNGVAIASRKVSGKDILNAPSRFTVDSKLIRQANEIRIRRKQGESALYFAAEAKFFSLEEPIPAAGNEIFVKRQYYKLAGRPTLLKGYVYDSEPLEDGGSVKSGERVETVLTIEAKNNYEYLLFEDLKPAGLEALEIRSGENLYARELKAGAVERKFSETNSEPLKASEQSLKRETGAASRVRKLAVPVSVRRSTDASNYTDRTRWVYQELRDRKVALFLDKLPEGVWEIRYDLRAEVPGQFHALPVTGSAMYVPEIRCNSSEVRLKVMEASGQ